MENGSKVLCVDLDGTLVRTDTLMESLVGSLRKRPAAILRVILGLLRDRAKGKAALARDFGPDVTRLPFCKELIDYLQGERARGRRIVMATGADESIAQKVANHLGLFDDVLASDGSTSLTGKRKLASLKERFGLNGFDYIGDSLRDIHVWKATGTAMTVNPGFLVTLALRFLTIPQVAVSRTGGPSLSLLNRLLRFHHWSKNLLMFVPLVLSHRLFELDRLGRTAIAAIAFGFVASAIYVINDVLDIEADRKHAEKRKRALASGEVGIPTAGVLAAGCGLAGLLMGWIVDARIFVLLSGYASLALLYSLVLKRLVLIDVFALGTFYALRITAGGLASDVAISPWLLQFSLFAFLSLSLLKRYAELRYFHLANPAGKVERRGYLGVDLEHLALCGTASATVSALVIGLYVNSTDVTALYSRPQLLWGLCPLVLYWFLRIWMLAHRGVVSDDPLIIAFKDRSTWLVGIACAVLLGFAI
jgi:4-hydroxybenzoate polyprenyltransferase/phosphoglycolate phosphatase-like HAD superfamily hydrolase